MSKSLKVHLLVTFSELSMGLRPLREVGFFYKGNLVKFITYKDLKDFIAAGYDVELVPFKD